MELEILKYPHPVLKQKAVEVKTDEINQELKEIVTKMSKLMVESSGVGLAAVQVGITKRFFIMLADLESENPDIIVAINPTIIETEGEIIDEEGCLSFPGVSAKVKRATRVKMKALDIDGNEYIMEQDGYLARCIQHEIDHLDGITYFDHLGPVKRQMIEKKYKKLMKENSSAKV